MKVKALKTGYYDNARRREGSVFEMADHDYSPVDKKGNRLVNLDGTEYRPTWVVPVSKREVIEDEFDDEMEDAPPKKRQGRKPKSELDNVI